MPRWVPRWPGTVWGGWHRSGAVDSGAWRRGEPPPCARCGQKVKAGAEAGLAPAPPIIWAAEQSSRGWSQLCTKPCEAAAAARGRIGVRSRAPPLLQLLGSSSSARALLQLPPCRAVVPQSPHGSLRPPWDSDGEVQGGRTGFSRSRLCACTRRASLHQYKRNLSWTMAGGFSNTFGRCSSTESGLLKILAPCCRHPP